MNCSKCNALIPDDAAFCPECGAPVESPAVEEPVSRSFCPNCGAELQGDAAFCGNCGERLTSPAAPKTKTGSAPKKARTGKKFPIKKVLLLVVVLAMAAAVVLLAPSLFRGGSDSYVVYMKNAQLQYGELPKLEEVQEITTKLTSEGSMDDPEDLQEFIRITEDGKKLFYPDRVECDEYGWLEKVTLYCRQINKPKQDPIKIDSGITYYEINKDGTMVYYIKNENLYQHDLKDKEKIDGDVEVFRLSEDGKSLLYATRNEESDGSESYDMYLLQNGKDPEKILSSITDLEYSSPDFSLLVYVKNDSLYVKRKDEDAVKIDSDIRWVVDAYESGEIYYTKVNQEFLTYWDVIEDDIQDKDYSDYYFEYLSSSSLYIPLETLYYYNGEESVVIAENVLDWDFDCDSQAVGVVRCYGGEIIPKLKLSEYVDSYPDIYDWFYDELDKDIISYVVTGEKSAELDLGDIYSVRTNAAGTIMYVGVDIDEEGRYCSLYKVVLSDDGIESSDLLDDEVYWRLRLQEDSVIYFKEVNEGLGELYRDGNHIDDDVASDYLVYIDQENMYYMKDYNYDKDLGTLTYYDGKKTETVKDDVNQFVVAGDGSVLFLYDYNINRAKGDLWILDGKKTTKLDEDVTAIIYIS